MTKKTTHVDRLGIERKNPVINREDQRVYMALVRDYARALSRHDWEAFKIWSRDEWPLLRGWARSATGIEVGSSLMRRKIEELALSDMRCG
ncbi:MAG: hypothetical protein EBT18_10755 [Gammaproteobacteria bacterium]|nr:hypothetical protein [Gammaproteobacteria bacterium]